MPPSTSASARAAHFHAPPSPSTAAAAFSLGALASGAPEPSAPTARGAHAKAIAPAIAPAPAPAPGLPSTARAPARGALKPKQKRYRANPEQLRDLVALFEQNPSPAASELSSLANRIAMPTQSVVLWFKNRRARVPHKRAEKAEAARRREAAAARRPPAHPKGGVQPPAPPRLPVPALPAPESAAAAAMVMAEMALSKRASGAPGRPGANLDALCNVAIAEASRESPPRTGPVEQSAQVAAATSAGSPAGGPVSYPLRMPSTGVAPTRLADFVLSTPRRPRAAFAFAASDPVELVEPADGDPAAERVWRPAVIICPLGPPDIGVQLPDSPAPGEADKRSGDGPDDRLSPRTVQSPASSPGGARGYRVRVRGRVEDVAAARLRPSPPPAAPAWSPGPGEAAEALLDGAWCVGVMHEHDARKGFLVCLDGGERRWVRREGLRPHAILEGAGWVVKMCPPAGLKRSRVETAAIIAEVVPKRARVNAHAGRYVAAGHV